jgi:hypothetical protein
MPAEERAGGFPASVGRLEVNGGEVEAHGVSSRARAESHQFEELRVRQIGHALIGRSAMKIAEDRAHE